MPDSGARLPGGATPESASSPIPECRDWSAPYSCDGGGLFPGGPPPGRIRARSGPVPRTRSVESRRPPARVVAPRGRIVVANRPLAIPGELVGNGPVRPAMKSIKPPWFAPGQRCFPRLSLLRSDFLDQGSSFSSLSVPTFHGAFHAIPICDPDDGPLGTTGPGSPLRCRSIERSSCHASHS